MKFTDGYWQLRPGVTMYRPAEAYDVAAAAGRLTIYAPARAVGHRNDTLNNALLTVELWSPLVEVIGVRVTHFAGGQVRAPRFELTHGPAGAAEAAASAAVDEAAAVLTSGRLAARVPRQGGWQIDFLGEGQPLTSSPARGMGYAEVAGAGSFAFGQLTLGVGENVYGLGERFTPFVKNGQVVDLWNQDGGTASEQAYKNIPFYLTNRGYGVFVNDSGPVSFEIASENVTRAQFSLPGQSLEYAILYGPTPKEVLEKYTALTGRPALPPAWSFGLWLSTSFTTAYDEATVTGFIQGMAERQIPLAVFHFDCFWMREFNWCDFVWDPRTFPDPPAMLARLKARGLHVCVWINPYIAQRSPLFAEGQRAGYLLKQPNGDVWQTDQWQAGMGVVDFTNPAAREWYASKLRALVDMGVDCFKTDFGERIPTDVVYFDGADPVRMHNYYTLLYNQTVFETLREQRGAGEAVVFARSATTGGQRYPVHWGGDSEPTFVSMAESLRGGLSLGLAGFGFWSHDIGGFEGLPNAPVYKRWVAFGLLSSHSRLHGSASYRVPWIYDEEAVDVLRLFTRLKGRLMPYLFAAAMEAHARGVPVLRAMLLEFPDDPGSETLDRQYMLGERLLVAPVFSAEGDVSYYLPAGRWTHLLTGQVIEGPGWQRETHGYLSLPLLVRPNTLLAFGARDDRPDYDYADGVELRLYALADGATAAAVVPTVTGEVAATFVARRAGQAITVEREGAAKAWRVTVVGSDQVATAEAETARVVVTLK
jgi:alpha-D-xyloside xylohydrolase